MFLDNMFMVSEIKADNRIMSGKAILGNESGDRSFAELGKEHIMPHAETDYNIECGSGFIEKFGLEERIAGCLKFLWAYYLVLRE